MGKKKHSKKEYGNIFFTALVIKSKEPRMIATPAYILVGNLIPHTCNLQNIPSIYIPPKM